MFIRNSLAFRWAENQDVQSHCKSEQDSAYEQPLCPCHRSVSSILLVWLAGVHTMSDGAVGETMVRIARGKIALDPVSALARGVLCNVLVCLVVHGRAECDR